MQSGQRRPRSPGIAYGALALLLLIAVGVTSLTASRPPPPQIAEFAPQAQEQIEEAPEEQSSRVGSGEGECLPGTSGCEDVGGPSPTPTLVPAATPEPVEVSRVRQCVGDPPRQIEDPQSPPCVPYWEGDNGGPTSKGVTRDEVRIAIGNSSPWAEQQIPLFTSFFNKRFEFYGRKLRVRLFGCDNDQPQEQMIADAEAIDDQFAPFAVSSYCDNKGGEQPFFDELARRKIVNVNNRVTYMDERHFRERHPYQWSYVPSYDIMAGTMGAWICDSLEGQPARYAGGLQEGEPRKFGLMYQRSPEGYLPELDSIRSALARCDLRFSQEADITEGASTAVVQFGQADITSVVCVCDAPPITDATSQRYFPEWLVDFMQIDGDTIGRLNDVGTNNTFFGPWWWNKQKPPSESPWHWALKQADPDFRYQDPPVDYYDTRWHYHPLLVIASGIQMAGPNLTPENFARGLQEAAFPNPDAGARPYYQAHIGFRGDHSAQNTAAITWWDGTAESSWDGAGTWCYVDHGTRWGPKQGKRFPSNDSRLYADDCA